MIGRTLGHYRIESKLGEGGMGVVYRAFDTHLDRAVAIKILRPEVTVSPERKRRFVQEAKAASALNHPNIIHYYDIDTSDGTGFIAMEFVPGKTLDQLIGRRGLPLKDVLKYAIQMADGLARAHSAGIVHRDLKPANIIVGDDGRLKLLDFGLAKLTETVPGDPDDATATLTAAETPQTEEGSIVGTAAYMSPEQAEGKPVDARSDIFSFGSVLYEMVTGRRAFEGPTRLSTLSAVVNKEPPPLAGAAPNLPPDFEKIIARCLRKDPDRRTRHMDDVRLALEDLKDDSESGKISRPPAPPPARRALRFAAIAACALALVAAGLALEHWRKPAAQGRSEWVQITNLPDSVSQPALSADGRMLTFIRGPRTFYTQGQVYVKMLPSGDPVQLTHDDSLKMSPAFSPDGSRIAYTTFTVGLGGAGWNTLEVPVLGGEPRLWIPNASGLVWLDKSKLLFSEIKSGNHMAIVTAEETRAGLHDVYLPAHQRGMAHRSYASPDRKSVLLVEMDENGSFGPCRLVPLDGSSPGRQIGPPGGSCRFAAWSPDGQWMYFSSSVDGASHTWRQRFDHGQPEQITSGPTEEEGIAMAPDGRSFLTSVGVTHSAVWLHDARGERQISLEGYSYHPKFTPDGKRLCYLVQTDTGAELRIVDLDSGRIEALLPGFALSGSFPYDISPDGLRVVVSSAAKTGKPHLWLAPLDRRSAPHQIPNAEGEQPRFGDAGEFLFRKVEGSSAFLYRIHEDGSDLRKAIEEPIADLRGLSPDHRWAAVFSGRQETDGRAWLVYPLAGGAPMRAFAGRHEWSGEGKYWFLEHPSLAITQVMPLAAGQVWSKDPSGSIPFTIPEIEKLPGVQTIPSGDVAPGPTGDVYAFSRSTVQRNIYRIPLPAQ